jgi:hypothetical protein
MHYQTFTEVKKNEAWERCEDEGYINVSKLTAEDALRCYTYYLKDWYKETGDAEYRVVIIAEGGDILSKAEYCITDHLSSIVIDDDLHLDVSATDAYRVQEWRDSEDYYKVHLFNENGKEVK